MSKNLSNYESPKLEIVCLLGISKTYPLNTLSLAPCIIELNAKLKIKEHEYQQTHLQQGCGRVLHADGSGPRLGQHQAQEDYPHSQPFICEVNKERFDQILFLLLIKTQKETEDQRN